MQDNIIVGDFNCGPNVSISNYNKFLEAGFISLDSSINTWDPKNPLNINGIHKNCKEQSIDHILINSSFSLKSKSSNTKLIFSEPIIETIAQPVTLSDHYGLCFEI
jgi:endonuclease/exonuclease/phosphatase family metal-dependent hydrolase